MSVLKNNVKWNSWTPILLNLLNSSALFKPIRISPFLELVSFIAHRDCCSNFDVSSIGDGRHLRQEHTGDIYFVMVQYALPFFTSATHSTADATALEPPARMLIAMTQTAGPCCPAKCYLSIVCRRRRLRTMNSTVKPRQTMRENERCKLRNGEHTHAQCVCVCVSEPGTKVRIYLKVKSSDNRRRCWTLRTGKCACPRNERRLINSWANCAEAQTKI